MIRNNSKYTESTVEILIRFNNWKSLNTQSIQNEDVCAHFTTALSNLIVDFAIRIIDNQKCNETSASLRNELDIMNQIHQTYLKADGTAATIEGIPLRNRKLFPNETIKDRTIKTLDSELNIIDKIIKIRSCDDDDDDDTSILKILISNRRSSKNSSKVIRVFKFTNVYFRRSIFGRN
ncbi:hypothetical protein ACTA71_004971 [Dictyostelium dimigraforme]